MSTQEAYAFLAFGDRSVGPVDTAAVRDALVPIWLTKPETARRLRQRIRTVIVHAAEDLIANKVEASERKSAFGSFLAEICLSANDPIADMVVDEPFRTGRSRWVRARR